MPNTLDLAASVEIIEGEDRRKRRFTASEQTVVAFAWHLLTLATNSKIEVPLGSFGLSVGPRWVYVESDAPVLVNQTSQVTGCWPLATNGIMAAHLTQSTHLWVHNQSTALEATVEIVVAVPNITF